MRTMLAGIWAVFWLVAALPAAAQIVPDLSPATAEKVAENDRKELAADLTDRAAISERTLKLIAADRGEKSAPYLAKLLVHANNLSWAHRAPESRQALVRAVEIATALYGAGTYATADVERQYAIALRVNGYREEAIEPFSHYVHALTEEAYGCGRRVPGMVMGCARDDTDLGDTLLEYGQMLNDVGRGGEAVAAFDAVIARFEPRWAGCEGPAWGTRCDRARDKRADMLSSYAALLALVGRADDAGALRKRLFDDSLAAIDACTGDDCEGPDFRLVRRYYDYRAALAGANHPDDALALDERILAILVASPHYTKGKAGSGEYFDKDMVNDVTGIAEAYAKAAVAAGKADRARDQLARYGFGALVGTQLAGIDFDAEQKAIEAERRTLSSYGDEIERIANSRRKVALFAGHYGKDSDEYAKALRDLAWDLDDLPVNDTEAEAVYREALAVERKAFGAGDFRTLHALDNLTTFLKKRDRSAAAIAVLADVLGDPANDHLALYLDPDRRSARRGSFGDPDDTLNALKADLSELLLRNRGDPALALAAARHAALGMTSFRDALGFDRFDEMKLDWVTADPWAWLGERRYADYFLLYADALWAKGVHDGAAAEQAFTALQDAMAGTTSRAVARAAAERAAARASVSPLVEERRRIDAEIAALNTKLETLPDDPAERQRQFSTLQSEIARKDDRRAQVDAAIAAATPDYFALIRPRPLAIAEAQALLAPDEAFVMLVPSEFGTHVLLVTHDALRWNRADMPAAEVNAHVRRLLWDVGASIDVTAEEDAKWSAEGEGDFPFDRGTAWLLYDRLLAPFAADLAGKRHLFTAATGSLSSLPLGILVTEKPTGADGDPAVLRATKWLADGPALLQLPSLQSLQLLRAVAARDEGQAGTRMVGFGDPVLEGQAAARGIAGARARGTRSSGLPVTAGLQPAIGDAQPLADPAALRRLARLPGTEAELKAMQALLGADAARLYLAGTATETNLKRSDLEHLSVLFLATHGLIAGEVKGLAEPGLVFTPPATATPLDDGLLTASEVAGLHLGARWVVLSACNTASGDGSEGAPGLSGLARAFFFAGAESLLASHWPVRDDVASVLTVRLFELMQTNPGLSRAEALQHAMRDIRNDLRADDFLKSWSHPSAWAPFSLIGDGID
ncbi:CHAT domain-containing protein [Sphingopyxis sp. Q841]|uniref:CHAT domain-containing protein n=1 Tax=Sphingopyxis sp. Q841 TaxID=3458250 RepID=UPI0040371F88